MQRMQHAILMEQDLMTGSLEQTGMQDLKKVDSLEGESLGDR